ncbi:NTE family protein [Dokdonella immobilis]|uniref:NTE family protein n=2 Tax=Dokdonella immobilis TaxID=578942 RepID=A0A1I4XTS6_9GAMM|nr:NTE family protein [Dokdonella immobilis]
MAQNQAHSRAGPICMDSVDTSQTRDILRALPLFRHLDDAALAELGGELQFFALPGGASLFEQGDTSDAFYVLKSGSLGAFRDDAGGQPRLVGVVAAGETVGEVGMIVDMPRNASVRALRDSELLRLSREAFDKLVNHHPKSMLAMARLAVRRLSAGEGEGSGSSLRTFAVLRHDAGVDVHGFAGELVRMLGAFGECAMISRETGEGRLSSWFNELEARTRYVVYVADADDHWQALCVRQADCLLLLANANDAPGDWPASACADASSALSRPRHLVLLHPGKLVHGAARRWLARTPLVPHHHVRDAHDIRRIARLLTGRCLSLVLSGGGARGFTQIGIVRALREAGLEIDCVGGTSIGAIIGAGVALEWSDQEMFDNYRHSFVASRPLGDYTLPLVALTRGRRVARLLREQFGESDITDLPLPYFCCSSNLSSGDLETHRHGPLWLWLRASCAIPGVLPPVCHRGQVYVDGAVINNLPTDIMHAQQPGAIAAVDIGADDALHTTLEEYNTPPMWKLLFEFGRGQRPGIFDILIRSGMVNAELASAERRHLATLLLEPPVRDIGLLDWKAYERAVEAGYQYALRVIGGRLERLHEQIPLRV